MFTMKFHKQSNDSWEVFHADSYCVETEKDGDGNVVKTVFFECAGMPRELFVQADHDPEVFQAAYVVNDIGNTVDRILIPS